MQIVKANTKKKASSQGRRARTFCNPPLPYIRPYLCNTCERWGPVMTLTSLFLDDLGYEDLASDVADDFDYYRDAIESRAGNTLISNNTL